MDNQEIVSKGRKLSRLLRHNKQNIDSHGWREVRDLIENHGCTWDELCEIVAKNDKQRFEFSDDKLRIRARQGHSINVDVELGEDVPPAVLYHGTAKNLVDSIMKQGITKSGRLHVHLSKTIEDAVKVGKRHGEPIVLTINTGQMVKDGVQFFLSRNGIWLTEFVDVKYIDL